MRNKIVMVVLSVALVVSLVIVGCAKPTPAPGPTPTPTPTPAPEQEVIKWRMSTNWSPSINMIEMDERLAEKITEASGGRLDIDFSPAGEVVGSMELFDAVSKGTLDAGCSWMNYWAGKNTAFDLMSSYPLGLQQLDYLIWYFQGGGKELLDDLCAKYNMVYFPHDSTSMESGLRCSKKKIDSLEAYKGVKARMSGMAQGYILEKLGASQVMLAGGEIYEALQRGTVDCGEFSSPGIDWGMGFQEVTKYWIAPGWHQVDSFCGTMINKDSWDALPADLKCLVEECCYSTLANSFAFHNYDSMDAMDKFETAGTEVVHLDEASLDKLQDYAWGYLEIASAENPDFAKIARSQIAYLKHAETWRDTCGRFGWGRNVESYPDLSEGHLATLK